MDSLTSKKFRTIRVNAYLVNKFNRILRILRPILFTSDGNSIITLCQCRSLGPTVGKLHLPNPRHLMITYGNRIVFPRLDLMAAICLIRLRFSSTLRKSNIHLVPSECSFRLQYISVRRKPTLV